MTIETGLPSRYEIRVLQEEHIEWASAIVLHSNLFHSPAWATIYPNDGTQRAYEGLPACDYLSRHQIKSGLSLGVFDKEYKFKRPESEAKGGALYWDPKDETADGQKLLEQMDFPLVSVALAYDGINALDMEKLMPLINVLPLFGLVFTILHEKDYRDPESWKAKAAGEVLMRQATSTRHDYEGKGLMGKMARYLMRTSAEKGYRIVEIDALHDAVAHVWSNPPAPFKGEVIAKVNMETYEREDDDGKLIKPFAPSKQTLYKISTLLK